MKVSEFIELNFNSEISKSISLKNDYINNNKIHNQIEYYYYSTKIANLKGSKLTIDVSYNTQSTLKRINQVLKMFNLDYSFNVKNKKTMLNNKPIENILVEFNIKTKKYKEIK